MSREITITLKVDNQFSTPLQQFNTEIGKVSQTTTELGTATQKQNSAFDGMAKSISAGIAAYAGWKGAQLVGEMYDLGRKVDTANEVFSALTKNIGGASTNMDALREATGGTVTNLDLMQGSNKLLQMGLVGNTEELSKMAGMAVRLGSSMGMDATKAMSDFSLMLANNSIMRLDQFGISSGAVRQRIIELQAATDGLSRSDAFKMAVMEIGSQALEKLGSAATAAETPIARLEASVSNMAQDFSGRFATGANAIVGIFQVASGSYPGQAENKAAGEELARNQAADFARSYFGVMEDYLDMSGVNKASNAFVSKLMFETAEAIKNDPNLDVGKFITDALIRGYQSGENVYVGDAQNYIDSFTATFQLANDEIAINISNQQLALKKKLYADFLAGDSGREFSAGVNVGAEWLVNQQGREDADKQASLQAQRESLAMLRERKELMDGIANSMTNAFGTAGYDTEFFDPALMQQKLDPSYMKSLMPDFMRQGQADQITRDYRIAQDELRKLQELADKKLISDGQLEASKNMVDNLGQMADQAQKAADAFKNLTLAQAFGQTGGGIQGEMTDQVVAQMKANGASDKDIAAMQQKLDLQSGRETQSSLQMKQVVVPMIAKMTADKAAEAMANVDAFIKEATLQGLSQNQIASSLPSVATGNFNISKEMGLYISGSTAKTSSGSKMFGDISGMGEAEAAGGTGGAGKKTPTAAMAGDMTQINKDSTVIDKNTRNIAESTSAAAKAAVTIRDAIAKIPESVKITFSFVADDPQGLVGLVRALTGGQLTLASTVKDNGGTVPGATSGKGSSKNNR